MKKIAAFLLTATFVISCGETKKNESQKEDPEVSKKETTSQALPSADYSSLLINYECDMDVSEVAKVLNIPETDVSLAKYQPPGGCSFRVKGFGQNGLGEDTAILWFLEEPGKAQVAKEIKSYLDDQANNEEVLGMGIQPAETGDSYITRQPFHGRVAIMNANYDSCLYMSYAPKHMYKTRTPEQHTALGEKTMALANYLLKKHKK